MESKFELQFEDCEYYLVRTDNNDVVATTDKILLKEYPGYMQKLSLKNCQAIENGYDLDELAEKEYPTSADDFTDTGLDRSESLRIAYEIGFQKALEILGNKKFTESDVINAFHVGRLYQGREGDTTIDNYLQSLQQTEWDCIIEMECPQCKEFGYISECRNNCNQKFLQPKLDENGCLILKRK